MFVSGNSSFCLDTKRSKKVKTVLVFAKLLVISSKIIQTRFAQTGIIFTTSFLVIFNAYLVRSFIKKIKMVIKLIKIKTIFDVNDYSFSLSQTASNNSCVFKEACI